MNNELIIPAKPKNLHLAPGVKAQAVTSDVYDICTRLEDVDPSLFILELTDGEKSSYVIMERCIDGEERMVYKTKQLDARIIKKCEYLKYVPLDKRLPKIEADMAKAEADMNEDSLEELYEDMGRPMLTDLEKTGFIQRGISYPKVGVNTPGKAR